jgi:hypothetical protein
MSSHSPAIKQLLDSLGKAPRGSHLSRIQPQDLALLKRFVTHLVNVEGKGVSTARVYKSLTASAIADGANPNNKVMMSALQAFRRFCASE